MAYRATHSIAGRDSGLLWAGLLVAALFWILEAALHGLASDQGTIADHLAPRDRHELWSRSLVSLLFIAFGVFAQRVVRRIDRSREEHRRLQARLEEALLQALNGFLPICAGCKRIRLEGSDPEREASWRPLEAYLNQRTGVQVTHSICPACERNLYWEHRRKPDCDYDI